METVPMHLMDMVPMEKWGLIHSYSLAVLSPSFSLPLFTSSFSAHDCLLAKLSAIYCIENKTVLFKKQNYKIHLHSLLLEYDFHYINGLQHGAQIDPS